MNFLHRLIRNLTLPNNAGPTQPRLVLGPDIPAILVTFYAPNTVTAVELAYSTATNYHYTAWMFVPATNQTLRAEGWVLGATVLESFAQYLDPTAGGGNQRQLFFGDAFGVLPNSIIYNFSGPSGGTLDPTANPYGALNLDPVNPVDFTIDGVSQGRGLVTRATQIVNSAPVGAELPMLATGSIRWRRARAYLVGHSVDVIGSIASNYALYNLRRNNVLGALISQQGYDMSATVGFSQHVVSGTVVVNSTAADINDNIVMCMIGNAAGGTCTEIGNALQVRQLNVWDIGYSADYPNGKQI